MKVMLQTVEVTEYMDDGASFTKPATDSDVAQWAADHGYALVPLEPTSSQLHAAEAEIAQWCSSSRQSRHHQIAGRIYKAMITTVQERTDS
jgi:hypothetical protein